MCDKGGNFAISLRKETILQTKKRKEHQILQRYIKKNKFPHRWRPPNNFLKIFFAKRQQRDNSNNNERKTQSLMNGKRGARLSRSHPKNACGRATERKRKREEDGVLCVCARVRSAENVGVVGPLLVFLLFCCYCGAMWYSDYQKILAGTS